MFISSNFRSSAKIMNSPYPRRTRPSFIYSNKSTIFLVILAISLFTLGFVLFNLQKHKYFDQLDQQNFTTTYSSNDNTLPIVKMASTFFVVLPSNVTDYPENRPNRYRVHLPKPLHLAGNYVCALYSIQYPRSWPSTIGTLEPQWIEIKIRDDYHQLGPFKSVQIPVPSASLNTVEELAEHLAESLKHAEQELRSTRRVRRSLPPWDRKQTSGESSTVAEEDEFTTTPYPTSPKKLCIRRGRKYLCRRLKKINPDGFETTRLTVEASAASTPFPPPKTTQPFKREVPHSQQVPLINVSSSSSSPPKDESKQTSPPAEPQFVIPHEQQIDTDASPPRELAHADQDQVEIAITPPPPPQTANEVNNYVTVNVSVEGSKGPSAKTPPPQQPQKPQSPAPPLMTTSFGSISVHVDEFPRSEAVDIGGEEVVTTTAQTPTPSTTTITTTTTKTSTLPTVKISSTTQDPDVRLRSTYNQIADIIQTIRIENLKNATTTINDDDTDDDDDSDGSGDEDGDVEFQYVRDPKRFRVTLAHPAISHLEMSEQLAYVLGYPNAKRILDGEVARYASDLHGGFSSFAVYARGLTEEVILGNSLSSVLRIVAVDGEQKHGQIVEKIFDSPMYVKVLPREINEIEIEIRTMTGQFVPFQFGNVITTLVFRKYLNL